MDKKELRDEFEKVYGAVSPCINHFDDADKRIVYNLAYTMFLQGVSYIAFEAELLPHDKDFFPQV